jgi:hypothetical protein
MNGGAQEKAQMAAFKAIVKRSKAQNRQKGTSTPLVPDGGVSETNACS